MLDLAIQCDGRSTRSTSHDTLRGKTAEATVQDMGVAWTGSASMTGAPSLRVPPSGRGSIAEPSDPGNAKRLRVWRLTWSENQVRTAARRDS